MQPSAMTEQTLLRQLIASAGVGRAVRPRHLMAPWHAGLLACYMHPDLPRNAVKGSGLYNDLLVLPQAPPFGSL